MNVELLYCSPNECVAYEQIQKYAFRCCYVEEVVVGKAATSLLLEVITCRDQYARPGLPERIRFTYSSYVCDCSFCYIACLIYNAMEMVA